MSYVVKLIIHWVLGAYHLKIGGTTIEASFIFTEEFFMKNSIRLRIGRQIQC